MLAKQAWKKRGRIDKIILYGSYARGGWVDEPHTAKGYQSDFDLLIIVNDKRLTDRVTYWLKLEDRLNRELAIARTLHTPVNFIVHSLQEVNDGLAHGRFFFMDVARDGIALYQFDDSELHTPKPNAKVPVLVDGPLVLTESAAILVYLAEKTGRLLPASGAGRARVFEQLFFHASGLGPAFGQAGFFKKQAAEPQPLAIARFEAEAARTAGMLDLALSTREFVAGDAFTIADIAHFGWLWRRAFAEVDISSLPHLSRWVAATEARPAVQRAIARVEALVPAA